MENYTGNGYDHRTKKEKSKKHRDYPHDAPCCGCAKHCLFNNPLHPYTQVLLSAIPTPDPIAERSRKRVDFDELDFDREGVLTEVAPDHFVLRKEEMK